MEEQYHLALELAKDYFVCTVSYMSFLCMSVDPLYKVKDCQRSRGVDWMRVSFNSCTRWGKQTEFLVLLRRVEQSLHISRKAQYPH